ncbi:MAG: helix-turn-helix domain-containing protein [Clostridia bacterium]|nr:helix-turn-helix domain-containing protein [Clostridia bacterium]
MNCNLFFKHVTLETLAKICIALQCGISDIVEIKWEKQ